jgi:hypothetical protein
MRSSAVTTIRAVLGARSNFNGRMRGATAGVCQRAGRPAIPSLDGTPAICCLGPLLNRQRCSRNPARNPDRRCFGSGFSTRASSTRASSTRASSTRASNTRASNTRASSTRASRRTRCSWWKEAVQSRCQWFCSACTCSLRRSALGGVQGEKESVQVVQQDGE